MYYVLSSVYNGPNSQQNLRGNCVWITEAPPKNNGRGEVQTEGWLGTRNDWAMFSHGEYESLRAAEKVAQEVIDASEYAGAYGESDNAYLATGDESAIAAWDLAALNQVSVADWDDLSFRQEILTLVYNGDLTITEARQAIRGTFGLALVGSLHELESAMEDAEGWDGEAFTVFTTDARDYIRELIDDYLDDWIDSGLFLPDSVYQNENGDLWAAWPNGDMYFMDAVKGSWNQFDDRLPSDARKVDVGKSFVSMDLLEELAEVR